MQVLRHCAVAAVLLLALCGPSLAGQPSSWSKATGAAIRLVPGASSPGERVAGLQIKLDEGWKTYWRNPGDSGAPPVFEWSGSDNVAEVTVLWPAPHRFEDEDGVSIGYKNEALLPLKVLPKDAAKPSTLVLSLSYAICKTICVPAKGEATLALDPGDQPDAGSAAMIAAAQANLPVPKALGADAPPALAHIAFDGSGKPARLTIDVKASPRAELFVDGPSDWYLPVPQAAPGAAGRRYTLVLDGLPKSADIVGKVLRFTLVDDSGSTETPYTLP
jgi:DsbC/DsbD-like thiol-disulfide interchange protein